MSKFNREILQVDNAKEKMIMAALMAGLLPSKFLVSLSKNPLSHMANLMVKTQQHMNVEDTLSAQRERHARPNSQSDKRKREQQQTLWKDRGSQVREGNGNHRIRPQVNLSPK